MRFISRALITGITGFVGSHLAEYIIREHPNIDLHGICRWRSPRDNIAHLPSNAYQLHYADLNDLGSLIRVIKEIAPDVIFHLAAQSYVQTSFSAPSDTLHTNIIGTNNLLEAIRLTETNPIFHCVSSSEVYGQVLPEDVPIKESTPLRPASPYAVSKVGEDMLALQYWLSYGIQTIRSRMFTHGGPRRGEVFFDSSFAKQIVQIELGLKPPVIYVGNLDSVRTIADVRDAVAAYWLLVQYGTIGDVYNIGGTYTTTVKDVLNDLLLFSNLNAHDINIVEAYWLLRPSDVTLQIPDCSKFIKQTGWQPKISYEQSMLDLLNYWRQKLVCLQAL